MEREKREVKFELADVSNKFFLHLHKVNQVVTFIYHSIKNYNTENLLLLETDNLPFVVDTGVKMDHKELRAESLAWLFKKALEELVIGLTESMIATHKICVANEFALKTRTIEFSRDEVDKEIESIFKRPLRLPFPRLLDEIERKMNTSLQLKSEILSINQIRNCLVHRNGVVSQLDINDESIKVLKLSYVDLIVSAEKNGEIIEMTMEHKKEPFVTSKIGLQNRHKEILFRVNDRVILNQHIFNGLTYTCVHFVHNLQGLVRQIKASQLESS